MRSSSSRLLLVAAAGACCCLALVLAVGVSTAPGGSGGVAVQGRPRPPSSPVLGVDSLVAARVNDYPAGGGGRDLPSGAAAAVEQDYGFVDPPPDTRRRGGTAPIPHS
ncbi:hypothetical protein BAE44_0012302 [Dichanthelium oligosanthes]|uniref:Uncharacterized protein n=1 Tax=Dichanthelium oligosanthes TaxID=888268 RepID=A0A1E5VNL9_9POAL|nr:hypothetical protein BAE44_0012302 [Dichanthelium oligosanthes]